MSLERRSYENVVMRDRNPQNTDLCCVGQRWLNTTTGEDFVCVARQYSQGQLYTKWAGSLGTWILPPSPGVDFFGDGSGIALWRLDGNALDDGGVWNGTWSGTEQYGTGRIGQAANFNGTSYIDFGTIGTGLRVITVSLWLNWSGTQSQIICGFDDGTGTVLYDVFIYQNHTGFNTKNGDEYGVPFTPTPNTWQHWCFEFNAGNVQANKIWVDGVPQTLSQLRGTPNNANAVISNKFLLGGSTIGLGFGGLIDHVRVFNRALTDAEVQQLAAEI